MHSSVDASAVLRPVISGLNRPNSLILAALLLFCLAAPGALLGQSLPGGSCTTSSDCPGDLCNPATCVGGTCTNTQVFCGGPPIAGAGCYNTEGMCNPSNGQCVYMEFPNGTNCGAPFDSLCNPHTCQSGICTPTPVTCTASDQCHVAGTCNTTTGLCSNPTAANGTTCNDGNACTQTDTCQDGVCTGSNPVTCTAQDQCHVAGTCNPSTGQCSDPNANDGSPCDNACFLTADCQAGVCVGVMNPVTCTAPDNCHAAGTCNPVTGVCTNPTLPEENCGASVTDGGFESDSNGQAPGSPWNVQTFLNSRGLATATPAALTDLQLASGGVAATFAEVATGGPFTQPDMTLGSSATLSWPRYGNAAAIINLNGSAQNVNVLSQSITVASGDLEADNKYHLRFTYAPVFADSADSTLIGPYYFFLITDTTTGKVVYSSFGYPKMSGLPWQSVTVNSVAYDYTAWQLADAALDPSKVSAGDTLNLEIFSASSQDSLYLGQLWIDGVGYVPGIVVEASATTQANPGGTITYTYNYANGASGAESNVAITVNTPANTVFESLTPPTGVICTTPQAGTAGAVTCPIGALASYASGSFSMVVQIDASTTPGTPLAHRNYLIQSYQENPLIGPPASTMIGCAADSDCSTVQWCNESTQLCTAQLANGGAIPTDRKHSKPVLNGQCTAAAAKVVCQSGVCDSNGNVCGLVNGDGSCQASTSSTVCVSGVCGSDGNCGYASGAGSTCTSATASTVCRTGFCNNANTCASTNVGAGCTSGSECSSGICSTTSGACLAVGSCNVDADCASGNWCNETGHICTATLANGSAMPTDPAHTSPTLSGTCTAPAAALVCQSGVCDPADNKCGLALGDGTCTAGIGDAACRQGDCTSAGICAMPSFVIAVNSDTTTGVSGNCVDQNSGQSSTGATGNSQCSLRDALAAVSAANASAANPANVTFDPTYFAATQPATQRTITLTQSSLSAPGGLVLTGPLNSSQAPLVTLDGSSPSLGNSIFTVNATSSISNFIVSGARAGNNNGGAFLIGAGGNLTLTSMQLSNNKANNGGALYNLGSMTVSGCTFSGNQAPTLGGAIYSAQPATVVNSTVMGNSASSGGGIYTAATVVLAADTIVSNTDTSSGGGVHADATTTLLNSIVYGNTDANGADDLSGTFPTLANNGNVYGVANGTVNSSVNLLTWMLPPGNYGGSTPSMLLEPASLASCAGLVSNVTYTDVNGKSQTLTVDQRGYPRSVSYGGSTCVDAGAVQSNYSLNFASAPQPEAPATALMAGKPFDIAVNVLESSQPFLAQSESVVLTLNSGSGALSPTQATASTSGGVASFTGLSISAAGSGDQLQVSLTLTPSGVTPAIPATATSTAFAVAPAQPVLSFKLSSASQIYGTVFPSSIVSTSATLEGVSFSAGQWSYSYAPASGSSTTASGTLTLDSTVLPAGSYAITSTFTPTDSSIQPASATASYTVSQATTTTTLSLGATALLFGDPIKLTATIKPAGGGVPTSNVTFYDGSTPLQSVGVSNGIASLTIQQPGLGTHSYTAQYAGDGNFLSSATTQASSALVEDFQFKTGTSSVTSVTILPGGTAVYTLTLTPTGGDTFPSTVTLSLSGQPAGFTSQILPDPLSAGSKATTITITVAVPKSSASNRRGILLASVFAAMPLGFVWLRGRIRLSLTALVVLGMLLFIVSSCGSSSGFITQKPQSYPLTLSATSASGNLTQSTTLSLTVQ